MPQKQVRKKSIFNTGEIPVNEIKLRMLDWSKRSGILLFLDSNDYPSAYGKYECLLAVGAVRTLDGNGEDLLTALQTEHNNNRDWLFGHIAYDYKNILEPKLNSDHPELTGFARFSFFVPDTVCYIKKGEASLCIESFTDPELVFSQIMGSELVAVPLPQLEFVGNTSKDEYVDVIEKLRVHIGNGDCYEVNYCNERHCINADVDPLSVFIKLNTISPAPFAAYYRIHDSYMMCASPERYLKKESRVVLSQPIKGTARRSADKNTDDAIKERLRNDIKERAENVMIVDLVRNDLARSCNTGSVRVDELFGIYTYPQVHQMISTVSGVLNEHTPFADAIRYSFPMGSMTGAPKYKVMRLIEQYEASRRELFSGTVGYIDPEGNFDLNVVIRSLFYNARSKYLSYQTGGAITYDSNAEQEWEEMRLKAWALERIFKTA